MLATFLPWVSLGSLAAAAGTEGDGWLTLGLFALTLLSSVLGARAERMSTRQRFWIVVVSILSALIAIHDLTGVHDIGFASVGAGLYLATLASLVVLVSATIGEHPFPAMFAIIAAAGTTFLGFVHIPYGSKLPTTKLCSKHGWSLANTFPNVDDYIGTSMSAANMKVAQALIDCGVLTSGGPSPSRTDEPQRRYEPSQATGPRCEVPNAETFGHTAFGHCVDVNSCIDPAVYYRGLCEGPANIVCCVSH